ncbi:MAG: hypothetical protein QM725_02445 [Lacibacter sp.]
MSRSAVAAFIADSIQNPEVSDTTGDEKSWYCWFTKTKTSNHLYGRN